MALRGIRVLELAGLAPVPFAGLILQDFGADVIRVDRRELPLFEDRLARGKKSVCLDLKNPLAVDAFRKLTITSDIILDPYRPGVMEKNGLGPDELFALNSKLIYARLTGYGQTGPMKKIGGHDINYCSISGMLSTMGRAGEPPTPPGNLAADFAGGSMIGVTGIMMALFERTKSGKGQVVDISMTEGLSYVGSCLHSMRSLGVWNGPRGSNLLDGGAPFYRTYQTKDGKYMAVGSIEPMFFERLVKGLGMSVQQLPKQMDFMKWEEMKVTFSEAFASKTREEWEKIFCDLDACVTPVLEIEEAQEYPQNVARNAFRETNYQGRINPCPAPAPILSRTPATGDDDNNAVVGKNTTEILKEAGLSGQEISELLAKGGAEQS
eukprot:CFRG6707T1